MEQIYSEAIQLNTVISLGVAILCLLLVFKGRPEISTGIYLAGMSWCVILKIGNIAQTWIFLATMFAAAFVFYLKEARFRLPKRDRWIIPWLLLWWIWTLTLLFFSIPDNTTLIRAFILSTVLPIPVVLLYSQSLERVGSFSLAYVLTTVLGGFVVLQYIAANYSNLIINPLTGAYGMGRLPIRNYHTFAYVYGVSIIMLIALFQQSRHLITRIFYACAMVYCLYFLYFSNSRQTLLATFIACILFLYWLFRCNSATSNRLRHLTKGKVWLLSAIGGFTLWFVYAKNPVIVLRNFATATEAASSIGEESRFVRWSTTVQTILDSNFLGTAYEAGNVHNFFLSVLANEGIIGFLLMSVFFVFSFRQMKNVWSVKEISEVTIWRMAFCCIFLSTFIHAQFSGDNLCAPELFWSVVFLWYSKQDTGQLD
ncbi:MAG: hypothetical protein A2X34_01305 [Elusimicrobia bacterium GWC2_51_8]|nr:MAG: hypothetical protein A2X33_04140 [Elusimicrobia bacterium GWA2_51_34]OGR63433.1 MAG: hypothetical protein A2X34_01305 [Elusimicrobia bacterium GWC2_51_8]HAF96501.1 hypothetical protein [Elusimicrobiota bacterium]HCE97580.1 hypothetical protein [Elusimicrobiota bacterium]